jgi:hypothetical protein
MKRNTLNIVPEEVGQQEASASTDLVIRNKTEEEALLATFCDRIDWYDTWRGMPKIAVDEEQRKELFLAYVRHSIEVMDWFIELVHGLDVLEGVLSDRRKRQEVAEASPTTEQVQVSRKPYVATRGGKKHGGR